MSSGSEKEICDEWHIFSEAFSYDCITFTVSGVTHWMPLPTPPEEEIGIREIKVKYCIHGMLGSCSRCDEKGKDKITDCECNYLARRKASPFMASEDVKCILSRKGK